MLKKSSITDHRLISLILRSCAAVMIVLIVSHVLDGAFSAEARAGKGRSMGRSSYGSSSRRLPPPSPQKEPPREILPQTPPVAPTARISRGGFLPGLAGGLAGGLIGSMLFGSLGHAGVPGQTSTGGIGFLEILVFAGLAYLGFRWWTSRQLTPNLQGPKNRTDRYDIAWPSQMPKVLDSPTLDSSKATDIFFQIQAAWTRKDLSIVKQFLGQEVAAQLSKDLAELNERGWINRLENISIREVRLVDEWEENHSKYVNFQFTASMLDYTINEKTGALVEGNEQVPVKFDEVWTFGCDSLTSNQWQLVAISQTT